MAEKEMYKSLIERINQLEKETKKKEISEKFLKTLFVISNAVSSDLTLYELYETIYKALNNLMNLPNFYIAIYDQKKHKIHFPFFVDQFDSETYYELSFLEEKSLTGEVILKKEPIFLTEKMLREREGAEKVIGTVPKIYIGIPLKVQQEIIGVMAVQSYSDPDYFKADDLDILVNVSNQIATAIDRKRKLDQIDLLQNSLSGIINSMPSILVGINKDYIVSQWNSRAVAETGIEPDMAIGKYLLEIFPRLKMNTHQIQKSMELGELQTIQKQAYLQDKEIKYEDIIIFPINTKSIRGAVIRIDDVSERVRLDEMMVQNEKMLSIGGMAAGIAHEINNPLAGIIQTANVMSRRLNEKQKIKANLLAAEEAGITLEAISQFMKAREIPRMLTAINESGQRIAEIVDNLLGFARKSDGTFTSFDLAKLLDATLELASADYNLRNQYDFKTIEIKKEYEGNLPKIPCEKSEIQQVLLNILSNGAQAIQKNKEKKEFFQGQFILRLIRNRQLEMIQIEIEDNGHGMSENIRKRIFEPFFTTKPIGIGTGLGLSVSYFIITENHRGELIVESTPGKGTKFIIRLPY